MHDKRSYMQIVFQQSIANTIVSTSTAAYHYQHADCSATQQNQQQHHNCYQFASLQKQQQREQEQEQEEETNRSTNNAYALSQGHQWCAALIMPHYTVLLHTFLYLLLIAHNINISHGAPQSSCILCDSDDRRTKNPQDHNYEEFLFEHQVSRQDAIVALKAFNESYSGGNAMEHVCKTVSCTDKVMKYCLGPQFINDHCWCELGHSEEGLPFVPHICYVGEKIYKASVGSCFFFEEVKECCCAAALAKQWRHISAANNLKYTTKSCAIFGTLSLLLWRFLIAQHFL